MIAKKEIINYQCLGLATETGVNTMDSETENTHCKQTANAKQQFYYNTQEFFLLLRSLPARHINTWRVGSRGWEQAGTRIPWSVLSEVCGEDKKKVIFEKPTSSQKGWTHVQSSLVFSRFNLKHKQRPDPSLKKKRREKKGEFMKQSNENKSRKSRQDTIM